MTDEEIAQKFAAILRDALLELDSTINFSWRRMFGGAGYYADGRMFAGWFSGASIALKLPEAERDALLQLKSARLVSVHYVEVPPAFLTASPLMVEWVAKSITYVNTLPLKKKRTPKPKKPLF